MKELICGRNSVLDAIENKLPLREVLTSRPELISSKSVRVRKVSKFELDKITGENHQGFVAYLSEFNYHSLNKILEDQPDTVLILDHIQDPHNLGAIMRSANAFGVKHIVIPKDRAAKVTGAALKVSSGGYINTNIIRANSLIDVITKLKKEGYWVYSTAFSDDSQPLSETKFDGKTVIILGSEGKGVSNTLLKHSDVKVHIKMKGTVQSLNVSVAAGIILSKI